MDCEQSSIPASCCKCWPQICIPCLEDDEVFVPQRCPWEKRKSFINCVAVLLYFLLEKKKKGVGGTVSFQQQIKISERPQVDCFRKEKKKKRETSFC